MAELTTSIPESLNPPKQWTPTGLTAAEVTDRRKRGLVNTEPPATGRTTVQIVQENVFTFINNCLFLLGLGLILVGRPVDALISIGVILTNVVVSVVQEVRAKRALDRIAILTRPTATVIRDGVSQVVSPRLIVMDDLLRVAPGDQIVVDGHVVDGRMLVDESLISGESSQIAKEPNDDVVSGTFCVSGTALYVATRLGEASTVNQLSMGARAFRRVLTPLQRQIHFVIRIVLLVVVYIEALVLANSLINMTPIAESVQQATIIASLVPNGLFVSIAVAYAIGAVRIVRFGALVQQSNAVESLSNVDILCLDKTGTLTTNRLIVEHIVPIGTSPESLTAGLGTFAASASVSNPTSQAIATAAPGTPAEIVSEVPFSSVWKWSAIAFPATDTKDPVAGRGIWALGAPEMLRAYLATSSIDAEAVWSNTAREIGDWTTRGMRVLLVACHPDSSLLKPSDDHPQLPHSMRPIGLVVLSDELRPEARATLASFVQSGVRPKIISGDNAETVAALARQAGLEGAFTLVTGSELDQMDEQQFCEAAERSTVFGRISPHQKERLIGALRQRGHYVAMIGDGVNDVLSLKKADLSIAMQSGTQATRSVADIVLMNDSFASLAPAVVEGQRIVNGMSYILALYLNRICTVSLVILTSMVIGVFPLALRHAALVSLLTVGIPTIFLAWWSRPGTHRDRNPRHQLFHVVVPATVVSSLLGLALFYAALMIGPVYDYMTDPTYPLDLVSAAIQSSTPVAQSALAAFLVFCGLFMIVFVQPPTAWWEGAEVVSGDWRPMFLASGLGLAFALMLEIPEFGELFALDPLPLYIKLLVMVAVTLWIFVVRFIYRRRLFERFLEIG